MRNTSQPPWLNPPLRAALRQTTRKDQQQIDRVVRLSGTSTTSLLSRAVTIVALLGALFVWMLLKD